MDASNILRFVVSLGCLSRIKCAIFSKYFPKRDQNVISRSLRMVIEGQADCFAIHHVCCSSVYREWGALLICVLVYAIQYFQIRFCAFCIIKNKWSRNASEWI